MAKRKKFGAISGVFTPSILTILGVIMYLRLPWIVGQAGLWATVGIVLVAHVISLSTGLSVASIATDKKVETGGTYYILSRSLGLPIGGTLGLALFVGLSFSVSLYLIGFAEVLLGYFGFEVTLNNIRLAGAAALGLLTILTFISTSLAIKSQYIILTILVLSLVSIFFGAPEVDPSQPLIAPMSGALPWIALFAIFFPAVTGFEAGVSMSGDLRDPKKNIPVGTITAVLTGLVVYLGLVFYLSYYVDRHTLVHDPSVLFVISWIPQLVVAGILGATLSSALGSILGAPRILQATALDKITPSFLGIGFGASNEPRNALLFTFTIALAGILIGELNVIARIVTIFFIITYGFLNITFAIESWAGTDFRPSFRIPGVVGIIGGVACIIVMIQLDVVAMIGASVLLMAIFVFLKKKELTLQTGDTWNSVWASLVKTGLGKLTSGNTKPKNWRPNIILFSGGAKERPYLIDTAKALVGKLGIFTNFELVESKNQKMLFSKKQQVITEEGTLQKGVFTRRHVTPDVYEGMEAIARIYGFSGFEPNTILMGWPANTKKPQAFQNLASNLKKLEYNRVFLHYDKTRGFGSKKRIDIWWSGEGRNLGFALALIRFITASNAWRSARIRILVITAHSNLVEKYYELLQQLLDNQRIDASIKVINNSVEKLPAHQIMQSESLDTDLSFVELVESDDFFARNNQLVQSFHCCMMVGASSSFDEVTVVRKPLEKKLKEEEISHEPDFEVVKKLKLSQREIIANEVYNLALASENVHRKLFQNGFRQEQQHMVAFIDSLLPVIQKTSRLMHDASQKDAKADVHGELLKVLNDFSFRAQFLLQKYIQEHLTREKEILQKSLDQYTDGIKAYLDELPTSIRIKYSWKEYQALKADSVLTGVFKNAKLIVARITRRPAVYKIKVVRAARYYLYHKRLNHMHTLLQQYSLHSLHIIAELRRVFSGFAELIEKGKTDTTSSEKYGYIIQMEKDRFSAAISLLADQTTQFFYQMGQEMQNQLIADLQNLNNILERPGANFLTRPFQKAFKKDKGLQTFLEEFPAVWHQNVFLFANKAFLDFYLRSLKHRIEAKIRKYLQEYQVLHNQSMLQPLDHIRQQVDQYMQTGQMSERLHKDLINKPSLNKFFNSLYDEITGLFPDLPASLPISGEDLSRNIENNDFGEIQEVIVEVRKTVEFSVSTELIDYCRKQGLELSASLQKSTGNIRDLISLLNFHLHSDSDPETAEQEKKHALVEDFRQTIGQEEHVFKQVVPLLEKSFFLGLKNAFAPLSVAVISKTSGTIKQKFRATQSEKVLQKMAQWRKNTLANLQQSFVNLIYSRSEGVLWMGKIEKTRSIAGLDNEKVYEYLEKTSPDSQIVKELPFYYAKLFSGQSGIGEDFWVGMQQEIQKCQSAINRFRNGHAGCLVITGARNSGKTSLSKFVTRMNFQADAIFTLRAPRECTADVSLFEQTLAKSIDPKSRKLDNALRQLDKSCAIIVNDLELWWERRSNGTQVVENLLRIIRSYPQKVLLVINCNPHALELIDKLTGLQSWALAMVSCQPFDARELKELILLRHQAGGMKFLLHQKHETEMSAWDYARFFNRIFDISKGNPGAAISLWLACIHKVSGKNIYLQKPQRVDTSFLEDLLPMQYYYLLQFVYHGRMSAARLAELLIQDKSTLEIQLLSLWQSGILQEKFPGIYSIHPALQQSILNKLAARKLL